MSPHSPASDVAFSPTVKAVQVERGSRGAYRRQEERGGFETEVTPELAAFIAGIDTAFLATASADGQPYVQHRGGPPGFIQVVDQHTLGFFDLSGNRQYVTTGNLRDNDRVCLFLMDYAHRGRVKVWGRARMVPVDDPAVARLRPPAGRAEQALLITVSAWDGNCSKYIPQKVNVSDVEPVIRALKARIAELEAAQRKMAATRAQDQ
jgi:predicted pyridoxine 5'-phosphate oxidase superfamily flavin-nucleotide-binding protein